MNKKVRKLARKSALAYKAKENEILVLEDLKFDQPKTKDFNSILANLKLDNSKTLFVVGGFDKNLVLSSRNIQNTKVVEATSLTTYDVLNANKLVIAESALEKIDNLLTK